MKTSHLLCYKISSWILLLFFTCNSLFASTLPTPCYSLYDNQINVSLSQVKNRNHKTKFVLTVHNSSNQKIYISENSLYVLGNEKTDYNIQYNNPVRPWTCIPPNKTKKLNIHVPNNNLKGNITIKGTITNHSPLLYSSLKYLYSNSAEEKFSLQFTN